MRRVSYKENIYLLNDMLIIPMAHDTLLMAVSKNNIKSFRCAKKKKKKNPNERLRESIKEMKDYILLKPSSRDYNMTVNFFIWWRGRKDM